MSDVHKLLNNFEGTVWMSSGVAVSGKAIFAEAMSFNGTPLLFVDTELLRDMQGNLHRVEPGGHRLNIFGSDKCCSWGSGRACGVPSSCAADRSSTNSERFNSSGDLSCAW